MKLTSPIIIMRDSLKNNARQSPKCFIDETEVSMQECGLQTEEKIETLKPNFWDQECDEHPTKTHCKVFDE